MSVDLLTVDRIEGEVAVCEKGGEVVNIPLSKIAGGVREGDVLRENKDLSSYTVDDNETERRKADISKRFNKIKSRDT